MCCDSWGHKVRAGVGRAPSVFTSHEGRGRLGPALPAAGRRRPALAAAALREVMRPPTALLPFSLPAPRPLLYFTESALGRRGTHAPPGVFVSIQPVFVFWLGHSTHLLLGNY